MKINSIITLLVASFFFGCTSEQSSTLPKQGLSATPYAEVLPSIGKKAMLLEFGSTTCASCVEMGKILYKVKQEYPQSGIYFIEVYNDQQAMRNYGIQMIPTQIFLNEQGAESDRHVGTLTYEQVVAKLKMERIIP